MRRARLDEALDEVGEVTDPLGQPRLLLGPLAAQRVELAQQRRSVVDEDLRGDDSVLRRGGLLDDARDPRAPPDVDEGLVPRLGLGDLRGDDGDLRPLREVLRDDLPDVEAEDLVRAHDDDDVRGQLGDLRRDPQEVVDVARAEPFDGAGASLFWDESPVAAAGAVEVPRPPAREVPVERGRLELHRDPHVGDAAVAEVAQREVDELVAAGEGDRWLRALACEDVHAGALAPRLDDAEDVRGRGEGRLRHARQRKPRKGSRNTSAGGPSLPGWGHDDDVHRDP